MTGLAVGDRKSTETGKVRVSGLDVQFAEAVGVSGYCSRREGRQIALSNSVRTGYSHLAPLAPLHFQSRVRVLAGKLASWLEICFALPARCVKLLSPVRDVLSEAAELDLSARKRSRSEYNALASPEFAEECGEGPACKVPPCICGRGSSTQMWHSWRPFCMSMGRSLPL